MGRAGSAREATQKMFASLDGGYDWRRLEARHSYRRGSRPETGRMTVTWGRSAGSMDEVHFAGRGRRQ
jgi:hypothetical protein